MVPGSRLSHSIGACLIVVWLGTPAGAQPSPQPLSILDVPFLSQSEALCGGAAVAMVLRYWGERQLDAESFAHLVDRSAAGIRTTALLDEVRRRGWTASAVDGRGDLIAAELAGGRPVLALLEDRPGTYHYVVIVAATPRAVILHDPARAPFRVMERDRFDERWKATGHWMAVITPEAARRAGPPRPETTGTSGDGCTDLLARGAELAQANQLDAAERTLTAALSCGGPEPLRELAGLRLLQRRWPEVAELATASLAEDPDDRHAWELLATSRFVQDDASGALEAWNHLDQPRVDLLSVRGLTRTRQRVVERLIDAPSGSVLTPAIFDRSRRRLRELPSTISSRLEYIPAASGLAELRAHVVERPLAPIDRWSLAGMALTAAARSEVGVTAGSPSGGGERISGSWRFWPGMPRGSVEVVSPAPWGGLWGADAFAERQPFAADVLPTARRAGVGLSVSNWVSARARVVLRGGLDAWDEHGQFGVASARLELLSRRERAAVDMTGSAWAGHDGFGSLAASVRLRSSSERQGFVALVSGGAGTATVQTPADLWFSGDTGRLRPIPLRAHPIIEDGGIALERAGRRIVHASAEGQQWWRPRGLLRLGFAVFADAARVDERLEEGARGDVDIGVGLRLVVPGLPGAFRADLVRGLRDGATAVSFTYGP